MNALARHVFSSDSLLQRSHISFCTRHSVETKQSPRTADGAGHLGQKISYVADTRQTVHWTERLFELWRYIFNEIMMLNLLLLDARNAC